MSGIEMFFVTKRTNCKLNATILMVKRNYKKRRRKTTSC